MKTIKDLVPSLEICKQLGEVKAFDRSIFVWVGTYEEPLLRKTFNENTLLIHAPTTDELLLELPKFIKRAEKNFTQENLVVFRNTFNDYVCKYESPLSPEIVELDSKLVQALASLFLKLKSESLL